jgi:hypothetical protein
MGGLGHSPLQLETWSPNSVTSQNQCARTAPWVKGLLFWGKLLNLAQRRQEGTAGMILYFLDLLCPHHLATVVSSLFVSFLFLFSVLRFEPRALEKPGKHLLFVFCF